jgi:hypothetical protein
VPKDLTARNRIAAYLSTHGPVEDRDGRATAVLKDAVGYTGTSLGFVQLISSMEKGGHISREVRGKRTYRIAPAAGMEKVPIELPDGPSNDGSAHDSAAEDGAAYTRAGIDYDQLAAALLAQVTRALTSRNDSNQPTASVRRRLDQLVARNAELERETARARAERDAVAAERDELRAQLDAASHNLSLLTERLGTPRRPQSAAAEQLGSEERALLYRLSERAGGRREAAS